VNYIAGSVTIIDPSRNVVVDTVPDVGKNPQDITYAPDGRHFYTANVNDNTVTVVDTTTDTATARVYTGKSPTSVTVLPNGRKAYVTDFEDGTIRVLKTA
jgi:serine/threonine-protein kinase